MHQVQKEWHDWEMKWGLKPELFAGAVKNTVLLRLLRAGISPQEAVLH
jgi:hypothetical protein